ncbi:MAG: hypothetical protein JSS66_14995 [Armatimonadetes bacterium]|nr:hypothetical protein [Armatimonadota bacterium]
MDTGIVVLLVLALAVTVVAFMATINLVKGLRGELKRLEAKVDGLQAQVAEQQQNLDAVRSVLESRPDDPFRSVLEAVDRYRSRGWLATTAFIGMRLVRSYLNGRGRRKALPSLDKQRSEK